MSNPKSPMQARIVVLILLVFVIALISGLSVMSYASRLTLDWAHTDKTNADLDVALAGIEWATEYEANVFDCSNMSGLLAKILGKQGFQVRIASDIFQHAWLLVKTKEGVQEVESTALARESVDNITLVVMPTNLVKLVAFTGQFRSSDNQYVVSPVPNGEESFTPFLLIGNDAEYYPVGNITLESRVGLWKVEWGEVESCNKK